MWGYVLIFKGKLPDACCRQMSKNISDDTVKVYTEIIYICGIIYSYYEDNIPKNRRFNLRGNRKDSEPNEKTQE